MKLKIDEQADTLYLTLNESPAFETEEVSSGIIVDYSEEGRVVGVELLHLPARPPGAERTGIITGKTLDGTPDSLYFVQGNTNEGSFLVRPKLQNELGDFTS